MYTVQSISESPAGISLSVLAVRDGTEPETVEFLISRELWQRRRLKPGESLSEEDFLEMEHGATFSRALARMRDILSYSGQSRHGLISRLRHYGFDDEICEETADYAVEHGLVQEEAQVERAVEIYLRRKFWGRKRIVAELSTRGYAADVIRTAVEAIPDEEYLRALDVILRRKYGTLPADPQERQKMVLSLLRLGYTGSEIKQAIEAFAE